MGKKSIVVLLTIIIFLSACVLGFTSVYRVDNVTLKVQGVSISDEAIEEEKALQKALLDEYKGDNWLFVKRTGAEKVLKEYPCFRLMKFEKKSPDGIIIEVVEDAEVYAVENTDGSYYILAADGMVLGTRTDSVNRLDGEANLLMKGFTITAVRGEIPCDDPSFTETLAFCIALSETLGGIRKNVVQVEKITKTPTGENFPATIIRLSMREGVKLYINAPQTLTKEKAQAAVEKYLSLSVLERTHGAITLMESATAIYEEIDVFKK